MSNAAVAATLAAIAACLACGGGGAATRPTAAQPAPDEASGSFTLRGAGYADVRMSYSTNGGGLVFCRRQASPPNALWVRLAATRAGDGAGGPHLDIDLCNVAGSSTYVTVHDVSAGLRCVDGLTWDMYWHDGPSRTFVTPPQAVGCEARLSVDAASLQGTFRCEGLTLVGGPGERLDVLDGSFRCTMTGP